ncbi:MAG: flagellar export chaperone FliS [Nitrospirae bacterium]|nr:flagellar export chaperone FliS [Nitrospirota bacterium]
MSPATVAQQYKDNQIASSTPLETVLMLYDGAVKFLREAIGALEKGDIPEKARLIIKAMNIIEYLQTCLDKEKGGEIAINLDRIYDYMMLQLTHANLKNDTKKIEEVLNLLLPLRDAWSQIIANEKNGQYSEGSQQPVINGQKTPAANNQSLTVDAPSHYVAKRIAVKA